MIALIAALESTLLQQAAAAVRTAQQANMLLLRQAPVPVTASLVWLVSTLVRMTAAVLWVTISLGGKVSVSHAV
jgi:hypothetical protein